MCRGPGARERMAEEMEEEITCREGAGGSWEAVGLC